MTAATNLYISNLAADYKHLFGFSFDYAPLRDTCALFCHFDCLSPIKNLT